MCSDQHWGAIHDPEILDVLRLTHVSLILLIEVNAPEELVVGSRSYEPHATGRVAVVADVDRALPHRRGLARGRAEGRAPPLLCRGGEFEVEAHERSHRAPVHESLPAF